MSIDVRLMVLWLKRLRGDPSKRSQFFSMPASTGIGCGGGGGGCMKAIHIINAESRVHAPVRLIYALWPVYLRVRLTIVTALEPS